MENLKPPINAVLCEKHPETFSCRYGNSYFYHRRKLENPTENLKYPTKVILCGKYLEVISRRYGNLYFLSLPEIRKSKAMIASELYKGFDIKLANTKSVPKPKRKDNMAVAKNKLRWLVNSNPDLTKFWTLTHKEKITDLKSSNILFRQFIQRLNYYYKKNIKYIAVPEIQRKRERKTGFAVWHYHLIIDADYIDKPILESIWRNGFCKPERIRSIKNAGRYISKYLTKDTSNRKLAHQKAYFTSQNLNPPLIKTAHSQFDIIENIKTIARFQNKIIKTETNSYKPENKENKRYIPQEIIYTNYTLSPLIQNCSLTT